MDRVHSIRYCTPHVLCPSTAAHPFVQYSSDLPDGTVFRSSVIESGWALGIDRHGRGLVQRIGDSREIAFSIVAERDSVVQRSVAVLLGKGFLAIWDSFPNIRFRKSQSSP